MGLVRLPKLETQAIATMKIRTRWSPGHFFLFVLLATPLFAAAPDKPSQVPQKYEFIRTLDLEGGVYAAGKAKHGAQFFRIETRYRDPDVNAYVGMLATFTRFNDNLAFGDPASGQNSPLLATWGADMGIVRGSHVWGLDIMGANMGEHVGFAPGFVGEHTLGNHFQIFHRTVIGLFAGDTVLDSDQGLIWSPWDVLGISVGYRLFASKQGNRSGPRAGLLLHFQTPKIPFIFPSIG